MSEKSIGAWYAFLDWRVNQVKKYPFQGYSDEVLYYTFLVRVAEGSVSVSRTARIEVDGEIEEIKKQNLINATRMPSPSEERSSMIVNGREISAYFLKK